MFVVVVPVVASIVLEGSEPEAWRAGLGSAVQCIAVAACGDLNLGVGKEIFPRFGANLETRLCPPSSYLILMFFELSLFSKNSVSQ